MTLRHSIDLTVLSTVGIWSPRKAARTPALQGAALPEEGGKEEGERKKKKGEIERDGKERRERGEIN